MKSNYLLGLAFICIELFLCCLFVQVFMTIFIQWKSLLSCKLGWDARDVRVELALYSRMRDSKEGFHRKCKHFSIDFTLLWTTPHQPALWWYYNHAHKSTSIAIIGRIHFSQELINDFLFQKLSNQRLRLVLVLNLKFVRKSNSMTEY